MYRGRRLSWLSWSSWCGGPSLIYPLVSHLSLTIFSSPPGPEPASLSLLDLDSFADDGRIHSKELLIKKARKWVEKKEELVFQEIWSGCVHRNQLVSISLLGQQKKPTGHGAMYWTLVFSLFDSDICKNASHVTQSGPDLDWGFASTDYRKDIKQNMKHVKYALLLKWQTCLIPENPSKTTSNRVCKKEPLLTVLISDANQSSFKQCSNSIDNLCSSTEDCVTRVSADSEEVLSLLLARSLSPDRLLTAPQERELKKLHRGKAAGPKVIGPHLLRACSSQLSCISPSR